MKELKKAYLEQKRRALLPKLENRSEQYEKLYIQALQYVSEGLTYKEVGAKMDKSARTIENYFLVMRKLLGCKTVAHLVASALRKKMIE